MATKGKKKVDASEPQPDIASEPQPDTDDRKGYQTPPLKPFIKSESRNPGGERDQLVQPTFPRHFGGIPGMLRHGEGISARFDDNSNCLTVGENISLSGEITSCDKLIVEGNVEVKLTNAETIEISSSGVFKGSAKVQTAQINGYFEGTLEVRDVLKIQKEGRVNGSVRYGKIVIESGGEISGDMASFDSPNGSAKPSDEN